jgi:hypothetical protein
MLTAILPHSRDEPAGDLDRKTPDPEFSVLARSPISVENSLRNVNGSTCSEMMMWEREARPASTTMIGPPRPRWCFA